MTGSADNFAVLFSGGANPGSNHSRYYNSLKGLYEVLVDQHGLAPENVVVLYADAGSGQPAFDQSLNQLDGLDRAGQLLRDAGVDLPTLEELEQFRKRLIKSNRMEGLAESDYNRLERLVNKINSFDVVSMELYGGRGQSGDYFANLDVLIRSDLSFARDRGSTVLSATPQMLEAVLQDPGAPGDLLNRVDGNDHTLVWTFDHGGFNGTIENDNWGKRSEGNRSTLTPWKARDITAHELAGWLTPLLNQGGASTLAFAQCFSGGLVEALEPQLSALPEAYAMSAANGYEVSNGFGFAEGIELSLSNANPLARDLFQEAKAANQYSFTGVYAPNGGEQLFGKEHPWAHPGDRGDFSVFAGDSALHPLEQQGISIIDDQAVVDGGDSEDVALDLLEDDHLGLQAALVEAGVMSGDDSITGMRLPDSGFIERDPAGELRYTPLADFNGQDSVGLEVQGMNGLRRLEIALDIQPVNDAPHATDNFVAVARRSPGTSFSVDPLTGFHGDFDIEGDQLSVVDYSDPEHGQLEFLGGSSFVYTPDAEFKGEDYFHYLLSDGTDTAVAEVTLDVGGRQLVQRGEDGVYKLPSALTDGEFVPIRGANGSLLTDQSSSRWDVAEAVQMDDGYALLVEGEGRREGRFRVWDAAFNGGLTKRRGWLSGAQLERRGYEAIFQRDFSGDGQILVSDPFVLQAGETNTQLPFLGVDQPY